MIFGKSVLIILVSAFFVIMSCDADINFDRALNVYDEDANLLTNISGELEFDSILITTTTSETFSIQNTGSSELNLTGNPIVEITSDEDLAFTVTEFPETTIKPGESTTFTIEFAPTFSKLYEATVSIITNDTDMTPFTFTISGTGLEPGINIKQDETYIPNGTGSYNFGIFRVFETTSEVTFTIENSGTYDLYLDGTPTIEISGTNAGLFTLNDSTLSSPIASGASTTFTLSFTPDSEGMKEAIITIANNDFNKAPYEFKVQGTGVQPEINLKQGTKNIEIGSGSYDFGTILINHISKPITFTIENLGTSALNFTGSPIITITGSDSTQFTVDQTMTTQSILPGNFTTFIISFNPNSIGRKKATVSIANDDSDENPYTFTVSGKTTTFDFNGDGYDDVVVGAENDDDGGSLSGCAFIFFGNSNPSSTIDAANANVRLIGKDINTFFGCSVSSAGDVNGDGFDDVIVGAYLDNSGSSISGCAYIFYGRSNSPSTIDADNANVQLVGAFSLDSFGCSVSSAGDVNGDGYDDVIVGASDNDDGGSHSGSAYIYYGSSSMSSKITVSSANVRLIGESAGDNFGISVSGAGDVNADGYDDVIIGVYNDDDGGSDSGCALIFYGGSSLSSPINASNANVRLVGEYTHDYFGYSVSGAGDVNADGFDDVIVGAYFNENNGRFTGAAYLFFGKQNMSSNIDASNADVKMYSSGRFDFFGYSVSDAGDINGDGFDDIIIGAYGVDRGGDSSGSAFIIFGNSAFLSTMNESYMDVEIYGNAGEDYFGISVSGAGDFNGDGYADVIVGAEGDDDGGTNSGCAFILNGNFQLLQGIRASNTDIRLIGQDSYDNFGCSVSGGN